jgi:hypothetical protein
MGPEFPGDELGRHPMVGFLLFDFDPYVLAEGRIAVAFDLDENVRQSLEEPLLLSVVQDALDDLKCHEWHCSTEK